MKKILSLLFLCVITQAVLAQDFSKNLSQAQVAYAGGNLSDSRFAMEQMLRELDVAIGKDILQLLPSKMEGLQANVKDDNVTGSGAGVGMGLFIHRSYGANPKTATLDIINNSPLLGGLQALLAIPFLANSADKNQKAVKVQGYKGILYKHENADSGKSDYELQVPLQNTLFTFKVGNSTETEILKLVNTVPLEKIAMMAN